MDKPENGDQHDGVVDAEIVDEPGVPAVPDAPVPPPDYSESGVPSFDYVRSRIESRGATADGGVELAGLGGSGPDVASLDDQLAERERKGKDKLAEIRRSMGLE
ncbi:hypothetical protein [Actinokineospora bangkokensis]|uniref:PspA domain-containing protein n=1 Tax=Actinokineospora bangkokensis TaxID=1193682 RepID=A0A1Q9LN82_9PSEU|nr:hypothetical protein [Actinokineospora bangkokensis]OLR93502.1 hypothetical protein BJP25_14445 [Actinokineospora bangkokensis]